jgi:hypothetical protein
MNTHLDTRMDLVAVTCRQDGRPYYAVDVTLANTVPIDAASSLSSSVAGPGTSGVERGNIKMIILVYGPPDSQNLGGDARNGVKGEFFGRVINCLTQKSPGNP